MDIPNMQNAGSLVVLGSINADHILNLQSFPTPGETVTGNHYQVAFGGKGANQAVAAGRSGANIAFIACTGDDSIGESVRQQLATDNIDISAAAASTPSTRTSPPPTPPGWRPGGHARTSYNSIENNSYIFRHGEFYACGKFS